MTKGLNTNKQKNWSYIKYTYGSGNIKKIYITGMPRRGFPLRLVFDAGLQILREHSRSSQEGPYSRQHVPPQRTVRLSVPFS